MNQRHHFYNALTAMEKVILDRDLMLNAVKYFFMKYPEEALQALEIPDAGSVDLHIPPLPITNAKPYGRSEYNVRLKVEWLNELWTHLPDKKVEAIKFLRGETGLGLKEAKDIVEFITEENIRS